jgi:hypothetical protein
VFVVVVPHTSGQQWLGPTSDAVWQQVQQRVGAEVRFLFWCALLLLFVVVVPDAPGQQWLGLTPDAVWQQVQQRVSAKTLYFSVLCSPDVGQHATWCMQCLMQCGNKCSSGWELRFRFSASVCFAPAVCGGGA